MKQSRRVNEFNERRSLDMRVLSAPTGTTCQHHDEWTQTFAAASDNVLGDLIDEWDGAFQAGADDLVDRRHVGSDEDTDFFERHEMEQAVGLASYLTATRQRMASHPARL
jgi:hypothetical protein